MSDRDVLLDGVRVPRFLYGTAWKEDETRRLTELALRQGFRGIDTANQRKHYHEAAVGEAVASAIESGLVARQDLFNAGNTSVYVQDGTYLKLREVTLAYNLPAGFTRGLLGSSVRYARLSLSGRNLLRFTGYRGLDPEVSNFGNQAIVRNIDVAPFPPSRSFFFSIDLGF